MTVACSESWKDKQSGERKERTEWVRVVCFNDNVTSVIERFVKKGSKVYVEGSLQTRKWTDQSGQDKYSTEVVIERYRGDLLLLDSRRDAGEAPRSEPVTSKPSQPAADDLDDEVPF